MGGPGLHVTIATEPRSSLSVTAEVRLTKAALLYADDVTLCSANVAMLDSIGRILDQPSRVRTRQISEIASVLLEPGVREQFELLDSQPRSVRRRHRIFAELDEKLSGTAREVEDVIRGMRRDNAMDEIQLAIDAGLVTVDRLGLEPIALIQESILRAAKRPETGVVKNIAVTTLFDRIGSIAAVGAGTYPLFDDGMSDIVNTMIEAGLLRDPATSPAGQAGLGAHFIAYLPAFPDARTDEIIDVRRGLAKPLVGFRSAIAEMAGTLESAAWEPGFKQEADDLYRANVAPALQELEENASDQGAFRLAAHAGSSQAPWASAGAVLALGLTGATVVPDLAALALSVGAPTAALVAGAAEAVKERMRLRRVADHNRFVFLFRADRALARRTK